MQLTGFEEVTEDGITYNKPIYEEKKLIGAVFDVFAAEDIVGGDGTLYHHKDDKVGSITTSADVDSVKKRRKRIRLVLVLLGGYQAR